MDIGIMDGVWGGGATVITTIGGWLIKGHNDRIKKIEDEQDILDKDLSTYKLDSEKRYAKEDTLQLSLSRIHDRLDYTATKNDLMSLKEDIKTLLQKD